MVRTGAYSDNMQCNVQVHTTIPKSLTVHHHRMYMEKRLNILTNF